MTKRKAKPLTVQAEQKKKKQKNIDAEKILDKLNRDDETRRERRSNPEYLQAESSRDSQSRQTRRLDPDFVQAETSRDSQSRQMRRSDLEFVQAESSRDSQSRQSRRSNPDFLQAESSRDSQSRQSRRSDPDFLQAESSRDSLSRQSRRSDPDFLQAESSRNLLGHQNRRSDSDYLQAESSRDLVSIRIRRAIRIPWEKALSKYNANIKDGPFHRCFSCDRLFFKTQVMVTSREKLQEKRGCTDEYLTKLILPELIDDAEYTFCSTCIAHIRKQTYPKLNINESNLRFPDIPDCLKKLTPLAERCVAARIPFMKIEQANYAGQLKIKSGIVNVPIDVSTAVNAIPRSVDETYVIEVSLMRKMAYKNPYLRERVRPADVWAAAEFLCQTPLYKDITLNQDFNPAGIIFQIVVSIKIY